MFKIAEYRPDQGGNLLSIWAGNLSFAGKSFGMSVGLLTGTCARFQQLLPGNAGRGPDPSQRGPAAPATPAVAVQPGRQGRVLPGNGQSQTHRQPSSVCTAPFPSRRGDGTWDRAQRAFIVVPQPRDCRTRKRKDSKLMPRNLVLGCSRRRELATRVILLLHTAAAGQHVTKQIPASGPGESAGSSKLRLFPSSTLCMLVSHNLQELKYQTRPLSERLCQ